MNELKIEWMHYDKEGETCTRCNNTGDNVKAAIKAILGNPKFIDVKITYKETKLTADKMPKSNTVIINGRTLEDILEAKASENYCHSCTCLEGERINCRTVEYKGNIYEDLSKEMIVEAIKTEVDR